jgi:hypothetical protein
MSHRKVLKWVERFEEERTMAGGSNRRVRRNRRITIDENESLIKIYTEKRIDIRT